VDAKTIIRRSDKTTFQSVAGEAILIRMDTGTYFSLNKVGTQFWEMLDGQQSIGEQAALIAGSYQVDPAIVTADLLELAAKMADEALVEVA
jgi:hypothetical protein